MSLKYEPSSEPLHISAKQLFLNSQALDWEKGAKMPEMCCNIKLSGHEVCYTIFKILLVKIMLCSKLHCQKVFKLKHISCKIAPAILQALDLEKGATLSLSLSLSLTHTHTLSLFLFFSHTHTHTYTVSLSLSLSLSHTHTLTLSRSLSREQVFAALRAVAKPEPLLTPQVHFRVCCSLCPNLVMS